MWVLQNIPSHTFVEPEKDIEWKPVFCNKILQVLNWIYLVQPNALDMPNMKNRKKQMSTEKKVI